jgi:group II intron reverse transcriptase/maturase
MKGTLGPEDISTRLDRVAKLAREKPELVLTTLAHHVDEDFLVEAHRRTRKDGAPGIDKQTAEQYAARLQENLRALLERFKAGTYRAPAVRRVQIPKGDGRMRPIGIPTFEDKVLQKAVTMLLESVYEQDFLSCSYGFRPGRSAHQAIQALWDSLTRIGGGWVLEADIEGFFDAVDHRHLRSFLDLRVRDGVLRRAIDKWLAAGVMDEGRLWHPDAGTPQGGVLSPLLANVYLHEVLDKWFERVVKPRLRGDAVLIRYADDFVVVFSREDDARRVMAVLPKRFDKYGLRLHPEKTQLIDFRRPNGRDRPRGCSFDLLGFRHFWAKSRKGWWVVRRKTEQSRFTRALRKVTEWCRRNRHLPIATQHLALSAKVRGHYAYFGITGNARALSRFLYAVQRGWRKWLDRRSQRARMNWEKFSRLLKRYPLPLIKIVHSVYARAASP